VLPSVAVTPHCGKLRVLLDKRKKRNSDNSGKREKKFRHLRKERTYFFSFFNISVLKR